MNFNREKLILRNSPFRRIFIISVLTSCLLGGCSILETRPSEEMSETIAALRAAKEVGAETIAPEIYRQAVETYTQAKNEYKFKNFSLAKNFAKKAKKLAEKAEYESILKGSSRSSIIPTEEPPPPEPPSTPESTSSTPHVQEGTPAFLMDEKSAPPVPTQSPTPTPNP